MPGGDDHIPSILQQLRSRLECQLLGEVCMDFVGGSGNRRAARDCSSIF